MVSYKYVLLLATLCSVILQVFSAECEVDPFAQSPSPLILVSDKEEFLYPNPGESVLKFEANETVELACTDGQIVVNGEPIRPVVKAECVSKRTFLVDKSRVSWEDISCSTPLQSTVKVTPYSCANGGRELDIGFKIDNKRFVKTIQICFDQKLESPIYSYYKLTKSIGSRASGVARPYFQQPKGIYTIGSVSKLYARTVQRKTINSQLGLDSDDQTYIQTNRNYYLARGHLTARADFVYPAQLNSTFYYVNVAPQWQIFNADNWESIEFSVRKYAEDNEINLQVWTGIHGTTTLPHDHTHHQVDLYLYADQHDKKVIPVPEFFWKVVYNPDKKLGVALIGINNPFKTNIKESIVCADVSDQIKWVSWEREIIKKGYSYACDISDLRKTVKAVPKLDVSGLLL